MLVPLASMTLLSAVVLVALTASDQPSPVGVVLTPLSASGVGEDEGRLYGEYFGQQLGESGRLRVITQGDVAAMLGMERQKQLLGCGEQQSSCLAELAGAMGSDALVVGSVGRLGSGLTVSLKILLATTGEVLVSGGGRFEDADGIQDWLEAFARRAEAAVLLKLRGVVVEPNASESRVASGGGLLSRIPLLPVLGGAVVTALGGASLFAAAQEETEIRSERSRYSERPQMLQASQRGRLLHTVGLAAVGAGVATMVASATWGLAFAGDSLTEVSVTASLNGVIVGGSF